MPSRSWFGFLTLRPARTRPQLPRSRAPGKRQATLPLHLEPLEERTLPSFGPPANFPVGSTPYSVAVGDFDRDGKLDLVTANFNSNTVSVLLGNGDGSFQKAADYSAGLNPVFVAVGASNGGGKLDLAVSDWGGRAVSVLPGNGDGTFQPAVTYAVRENPGGIAVGDFDRDGTPDLAVSGWNSHTVNVL